MRFEGIMTALITPLDENNCVIEDSLRELIRFQIQNGVHSLLVMGGSGEYIQMTMEERKKVISIAVDEIKGKIPLVVGILEPGLAPTIELGLYAKAAGADAILVVTPYYISPNQDGMIEYFRKIVTTIDMPTILYNVPKRTNNTLLPATVERLVNELPNIVGIKECTPSMAQIVELILRVGDRIAVLSGEEFFAVSEMMLGARGAVMASANVVPDVWVKMYELVKNREYEEAIRMNNTYFPFFKAIFAEANPGPLKEAARIRNLPVGYTSLPLGNLKDVTVKDLRTTMKMLHIIKQ